MKKHYFLLLFTFLGLLVSPLFLKAGFPPAISADFSADKVNVVVGEQVTFSDLSVISAPCPTNNISWVWSFGSGASPVQAIIDDSTFTGAIMNVSGLGKDQTIEYLTPGLKDVALTVTVASVSCLPSQTQTITKTSYINVIMGPVPTLSEWGLIVLTLLLLGMGTLALMQPSLQAKSKGGYSFSMKGRNWTFPYSEKHFVQAMAVTAGLMVLGYGASIWLTGGIASSDLIGGMLAAPVFAYLLHLMLGLKGE